MISISKLGGRLSVSYAEIIDFFTPNLSESWVWVNPLDLVNDLGVKESEILALSYSTKAAKEVRKRLKDQLGEKFYKLSTKTFHSLGLQIIRENIDLLGYTSDFEILNTSVRNKIIRKVLQNNSAYEKRD